jgi:hypothetical protein
MSFQHFPSANSHKTCTKGGGYIITIRYSSCGTSGLSKLLSNTRIQLRKALAQLNMKPSTLAVIAIINLLAVAVAVQAQTFESSTCWEMTTSQPFSGGKSEDAFKWHLLGGCTVTVELDGIPSAIWIAETKQTITVKNFTWHKPYQNPTGMTLAGSWMNSTGTRAIFAIKTW